MATLVVSDLHLGAVLGGDVLRRERPRELLMEAVGNCERLVLLGDVLELREQPLATVLESAYPFFEALGEALPRGAAVTVVPGNHDHQLAAPLIEKQRLRAGAPALGLEQVAKAGGSGPLGAIARRMPAVELTLAYPGIWIRPDVYAIHGHYLDCHISVPRAEVLGIHAIRRVLGRNGDFGSPADYEAIVAPLYAFTYQLAHAAVPGERSVSSNFSARVWSRLNARRPSLRSRALALAGIPAAVATLNRLGLGPFSADLSGSALRRAGVEAMAEVVRRLGVDAEHVLFGHTHRAGPLARDSGWETRLVNTGSWVYERSLTAGGPESPYWPGTVATVPENGPPQLQNLLRKLSADALDRC